MRKEWTLFITFLKIGAFTFGGGYAMIALLENEFVERKKWIKKDDFLNMVAIAESTPGPVAINSATYIGYKIAGLFGAAAATVAVCIAVGLCCTVGVHGCRRFFFFRLLYSDLRYSRTCDFLPEKTAERKRQLTMIYLKLFLNFLMIGALSFGGGYGMVSLVRETVISNGWLTESEFLNFIAVSESTPGPLAVNMATFIGSTQGGILGSFLATLGVVLPSFIIILLIAAVLKNLMKYAGVNAFLSGVRPCVIAMILATAIGMAISTLLGFTDIYSALAPDPKSILVFAILWLTHFGYKRIKKTAPSPIIMILFSAALGILLWGV